MIVRTRGDALGSMRRRESHSIRIGTASWADPGFVKDWYPKGLPPGERLAWYAEHFGLVEVNSSFYAVPSPEVVARWCEQTPRDFVFDVKLHQLLSRHSTQAKLLPPELRPKGDVERVELTPKLETALAKRFLQAMEPLVEAGKMGALLLQLTPGFGPRDHELAELDHLLDQLEGHRLAVELRNRGWLVGEQKEETLGYFHKRAVTLVAVDAPRSDHFTVMPSTDLVTNPRLAYLRAHGRNTAGYIRGRSVAQRFDYRYSDEEIADIAARSESLATLASETHVVFNNNKSNYAPLAAERLQKMVVK